MLDNNPATIGNTTFLALEEGMYIARCQNVEQRDNTAFPNPDGTPKRELNFTFSLAFNGMDRSAVRDVEGTEFAPFTRKVWRSGNIKPSYFFKTKQLTNSGEVFKSLGMNVESPAIEETEAIGRYCVVILKNNIDKAGKPRTNVESTMPYKGDITELDKLYAASQTDLVAAAEKTFNTPATDVSWIAKTKIPRTLPGIHAKSIYGRPGAQAPESSGSLDLSNIPTDLPF